MVRRSGLVLAALVAAWWLGLMQWPAQPPAIMGAAACLALATMVSVAGEIDRRQNERGQVRLPAIQLDSRGVPELQMRDLDADTARRALLCWSLPTTLLMHIVVLRSGVESLTHLVALSVGGYILAGVVAMIWWKVRR